MGTELLLEALEKVHLRDDNARHNECIDPILNEQRPRKRCRPNLDELKKELEAEFLAPSTQFSTEWLNRLQQRWNVPVDYTTLFTIAPTQTRTVTRFTREGLEGRVTGYKEVTVPASNANAKNSTSLSRKPANRADFVRGAAGFFPFTPGGLDGVEAIAAMEEEAMIKERGPVKKADLDRIFTFRGDQALLEVPPGFSHGLNFENVQTAVKNEDAHDVQEALEEESNDAVVSTEADVKDNHSGDFVNEEESESESESNEDEEIDSLLPVEFPALAPRGQLPMSSTRRKGKEWAHVVNVNRSIPNFRELVPEMAKDWPFELDTFQKEAIYHLEAGDSVFVAAHTSAGKTVVAEYAIALAAKHMTKAIYTSPIKALSNQKFRDFRDTFDEVGILTGDVQISPEASCLIMTTEILRSMLYRGADLLRDVEFVIFDEVHYVNDLERGVVWEEVIIMLPEHVTLILLSATVPNTYEFASWVGRTKKKNIYVISTRKRPVPLEHYLWADKKMCKIVDSEKKFLEGGWREANDILSGKTKSKAPPPQQVRENDRGNHRGRGNSGNQRGGRSQRGGRGQSQRGGGQQRGGFQNSRGQTPSQRGRGNIARTGRGGGRISAAQDKNVWVHLVQYLRKENLLPACMFIFSKKRCEENADSLANQDFCTANEKSAIHIIAEKSLARLRSEDRVLPQIIRIRELLSRGIAVHHGGLLPIVKELVEILFAKTYVKVLFATETFAMGLNLPTRTVVFSGYRKHDGHSFRNLLPGEYTQMSGRAGRRGIDTVGTVVIVTSGKTEAPPASELRQMILGDPTKLRSQFRLTYNMILNLLRVEALKIEEMIKRSFSENATQALLPEHQKKIELSEANLAKLKRESCEICDVDLEKCHQLAMDHQKLTQEMHVAIAASSLGRRSFTSKRLVVFKKDDARSIGIILREGIARGGSRSYVQILQYGALSTKREICDLLPFLPEFKKFFTPLPDNAVETKLEILDIPIQDVECVTQTTVKIDIQKLLRHRGDSVKQVKQEMARCAESWSSDAWNELDWGRIKNMNVRSLVEDRAAAAKAIQECVSIQCPTFLKHFSMQHDEWLIKENIVQLRQLMSDENLQLLPDYEQRVQVLKDLEFVDETSRVQLKGKVACEIHSADELVLTELILENVFSDFEPEEVVALLSTFVFQEKTDVIPTLTPKLEKGKDRIIEIAKNVNAYQIQHQVILSADDSDDFTARPRFGLMEVVYEWARGMSFNRITDLTDVLEGTIVRVITRLDETCREVKNAARIVGDPSLFQKMQQAQEMIKRDITAVGSLYM